MRARWLWRAQFGGSGEVNVREPAALELMRRPRPISLLGVPAELLATFARTYPEHLWTARKGPSRPDRWEELAPAFQAPVGELNLAALPLNLVPSFARRGWIKPLDAVLPPAQRARFAPAALRLSTLDDRIFAVPDDLTIFLFAVRLDVLRALRRPAPRTWRELELLWRELARNGKPFCAVDGKDLPGRMRLLLALLGANGANPANEPDAPGFRAAALETAAWMLRVQAAYSRHDPLAVDPNTLENLARGELACAFLDSGALAKLPVETARALKILPIPLGPSGHRPLGVFAGSGWVVPANAPAPDLAFEMLACLQAPELCVRLECSGGWNFLAQQALWKDARVLARYPYYRDARLLLNTPQPMEPARLDRARWATAAETLQLCRTEGASAEAWWDRLAVRRLQIARAEVRHQLLRRALEYIAAHPEHATGVRRVAAAVNRHHDYLNQLFRKHLGQSCGEYLRQRRMERARELLVDPTLAVKEVAAAIGMRNLASFSRAFRACWGCSPTVYRSRVAEPSAG